MSEVKLEAQPDDWLQYRVRVKRDAGFTLFELACLLSRVSVERTWEDALAAADQHHRDCGGRGGESPGVFLQKMEYRPDWLLSEQVAQTLQRLKTATGLPMRGTVTAPEARELAAMLKLTWPPELEPEKRPQQELAAMHADAPSMEPVERQEAQEARILREPADLPGDGREGTRARMYVPTVAPGVAEAVAAGDFTPCFFDMAEGRYTPDFAEKLKTLPRFVLPAIPHEVPNELRALAPDAEVLMRDGGPDALQKASVVLWIVRNRLERQARGRLTVGEAERALAEGTGGTEYVFREAMYRAHLSGALKLYRSREGTEVDALKDSDPDIDFLSWGLDCFVTAKGLNTWLEQCSITGYRFPEPVGPEAAPTPAVPAASPPDAPAQQKETPGQRQRRRLARLRELGEDMQRGADGEWRLAKKKHGAFMKLVREEKATGRPRSDKKDVSADLKAAAQTEADERKAAAPSWCPQ